MNAAQQDILIRTIFGHTVKVSQNKNDSMESIKQKVSKVEGTDLNSRSSATYVCWQMNDFNNPNNECIEIGHN